MVVFRPSEENREPKIFFVFFFEEMSFFLFLCFPILRSSCGGRHSIESELVLGNRQAQLPSDVASTTYQGGNVYSNLFGNLDAGPQLTIGSSNHGSIKKPEGEDSSRVFDEGAFC